MFNPIRKTFVFLIALVFAAFVFVPTCAAGMRRSKKPKEVLVQLPQPVQAERPDMDAVLADFKKMLGAYICANGERDIVIECDYVRNNSGLTKELPTDLSIWIRQVIEKLGKPFVTFNTLPPSALIQGPVASVIPMLQRDRPRPEAMFKIVGGLTRASEIEVNQKQLRADIRAGGGHTSADGQGTRDNQSTITSLRLV